MSLVRRTTLIAIGAVALMVAAGACSSDDADPAADGTVGVTLQDFTVSLDPATVDDTLHLLLKHERDIQRARAELGRARP